VSASHRFYPCAYEEATLNRPTVWAVYIWILIHLSGQLTQQVGAARAECNIEMAAMVREAPGAYLTADVKSTPPLSWRKTTTAVAHSLDSCAATLVEHWPPEVQRRVAAEMARTRLSLRTMLLGVVYAWTRRMEIR
jgi:hypothetical protein